MSLGEVAGRSDCPEANTPCCPLDITELASEKGASAWLMTLPIEEHGFSLHKQALGDALCVRYG